jgi:hypothetical protein
VIDMSDVLTIEISRLTRKMPKQSLFFYQCQNTTDYYGLHIPYCKEMEPLSVEVV